MTELERITEELLPHLRQYLHNDGSGFVAAYDKDGVEAILAKRDEEHERHRVEMAVDLADRWLEIDSLKAQLLIEHNNYQHLLVELGNANLELSNLKAQLDMQADAGNKYKATVEHYARQYEVFELTAPTREFDNSLNATSADVAKYKVDIEKSVMEDVLSMAESLGADYTPQRLRDCLTSNWGVR